MRATVKTYEAEMSAEEHAYIRQILRTHNLTGKHLEIGTAAGGTLVEMMKCFPDERRPEFVVIDPMTYFVDQLSVVKWNLSRGGLNPETVDYRITTSQAALDEAVAGDERFDFILIDGSHRIMSVIHDLKWCRVLNVGGIVCLHDYGSHLRGVTIAVDRFLKSNPHFEVIGQGGSVLGLRKKSAGASPEVNQSDLWYAYSWSWPLYIEKKITNRGKRFAKAA